jgi:LacI family transcriptional regulator
LGLNIPNDISVAGFNDSEGALFDPPLTSVREFPEELGTHLAEFVLRRIQTPDREPQTITIPTRIVLRKSTRQLTPRPSEDVSPEYPAERLAKV